MDPLSMAGLGIGLVGGIGSIFGTRKSNRDLQNLMGQDPSYKANPIAGQRLGLAQTLLNARMPGAAAAERNIYGAQANTMANVNRNATDSSQALALAAAGQGQANQAFGNLETQEAQDYQRRYGNLVGAQEGQIQEGDKVYQDQVRRFQDMAQIKGMQAQNRQSMWNSISNFGFGAMNLGMAGGMNALNPGSAGVRKTSTAGDWMNDRTMLPSTYRVPLAQY